MRPSELLEINDPYTAFCFDQACFYIKLQIQEGKEPIFHKKVKKFSDIFEGYSTRQIGKS